MLTLPACKITINIYIYNIYTKKMTIESLKQKIEQKMSALKT